MIKRLGCFWHWLWTGEGFFPTPELPEVTVKLEPSFSFTPNLTVNADDNALFWVAATIAAGSVARGLHPDFSGAIESARHLLKVMKEHTSK